MTRDLQLDSVKGALIFLVVYGHLIEQVHGDGWGLNVYQFVYLFHMPAFIFISGMLSHATLETEDVGKLVSRLLVPFMVFECIGLAVHYAARGTLPASVTNLQPAWTLWFFLSLLAWRLTAPLLLRFRYPVLVSVLLALLALSAKPTGTYLTLARTFSFLPFFMLGMVHGRDMVEAVRQRASMPWAVAAVVVMLLLLVGADHLHKNMLFGDSSFPKLDMTLWQGLLVRSGTWLLSLAATLALFRLLPTARLLAGWGRRSLVIYVWHAPLLIILREAIDWKALAEHTGPLFIALFVFDILLCMLLASERCHRFTEGLFNPVRRLLLPAHGAGLTPSR